jgi:hypothetical protein
VDKLDYIAQCLCLLAKSELCATSSLAPSYWLAFHVDTRESAFTHQWPIKSLREEPHDYTPNRATTAANILLRPHYLTFHLAEPSHISLHQLL